MARLSGQARAHYVRDMFARVARRYDLLNRLMTGGQDVRWRKRVVQLARLAPGNYLLDVGAGTGDLAREALKQQPIATVMALDFTLEMMRVGQQQGALNCCAGDALQLPFPNESFDAVVSGFLMRNVTDVDQALREQLRVLKPRGRIIVLDTTRRKRNLFSPFVWIHMHVVIPALGALVARSRDAYEYLPESTEHFLNAEELAARMTAAGFQGVQFEIRMFGSIAIHWAKRG